MARPIPTHFLNLPLLTSVSLPQLQESLSHFRARCSREVRSPNDSGLKRNILIPEAACRPLGTLHLTLGVMSLLTTDRLKAALELLDRIDLQSLLRDASAHVPDPTNTSSSHQEHNVESSSSALGPMEPTMSPPPTSSFSELALDPLTISLRGLDAFPSSAKATVLHARPYDPSSRLLPFCIAVQEVFIDAGLVKSENRPLTLHATVANTVYAKKSRRGEKERKGTITIDATELVELYGEHGGGQGEGEYVWADNVEIDRVRICKMGAKRVDDDSLGQEYEVISEKMIFDPK